jgi:LCP family protein required for cell wall assembly
VPGDPLSPQELKPGHGRRGLIAVLSAMSLLVAAGAGGAVATVQYAQHVLNRSHFAPNVIDKSVVGGPCYKSGCNYLVLGTDSRVGAIGPKNTLGQVSGVRSDTIMVVHVDAKTQHVTIVQFPRDLWVNIPGVGMNKINSAIDYGGPSLTAKTIENLTGWHINHILAVDIGGFEKIVNAIGGVEVCTNRWLIDSPSAYEQNVLHDGGSGLRLSPGCHNLNGIVAQQYVRARSVIGDCIPDFARIARQQTFLRAVMTKVLSPAELPHMLTIMPDLLGLLQTDSGMQVTDVLKLAHELQGISSGQADFRTVPSSLGWATQGGLQVSIVKLDPSANTLFKDVLEGKSPGSIGTQIPYTLTPASTKIVVVDQTPGGTAAQSVYDTLSKAGYEMIQPKLTAPAPAPATSSTAVPATPSPTGPSPVPSAGGSPSSSSFGGPVTGPYGAYGKSVILYANGQASASAAIKGFFGDLKVVQVPSLPGGAAVMVVVAPGWTPSAQPSVGPASSSPPGTPSCPYTVPGG